ARFASRPSEFFFFSTLKFRISNRRGLHRQIFHIYFSLLLSHLHRICNFYPLDNFFSLSSLRAISPSNHQLVRSVRVRRAHPADFARPFYSYNRAVAQPPVLCTPPEYSWPAASFPVRPAARSPAPCPPQKSRPPQSSSS